MKLLMSSGIYRFLEKAKVSVPVSRQIISPELKNTPVFRVIDSYIFRKALFCDSVSEAFLSQLAHRAGAYPGFRSMKRLGVFLLPLDGMLVHRRSLPSNLLGFPQQFAGTHLYSWVEKGTARVKCLAQEHNIMSSARAQNRTARSRDECTNHEAIA